MVEPIQGEAGVIIPDEGYLQGVRKLCDKYDVLLICDEVQTGFARTGALMCYDHEGVRPDIVVMAKALGGGMMPVSGVMCDDDIMLNIKPGEHGSTFGGNALACAVAKRAVELVFEENLCERSQKLGDILLDMLSQIKSPLVKDVRGKGLFCSLELQDDVEGSGLTAECMKRNVLVKATHKTVLRMAPALVITEDELYEAA